LVSTFPETFSAATIRAATQGLALASSVQYFEETTSTNDRAKLEARAGAQHGSLFVANLQTQGRGRQGRAWIAPAGTSLMFSVLIRPGEARAIAAAPIAAGIALQTVLARSTPNVQLKWPNDILASGRKLAGILVEASSQHGKIDALVVGIGINVHTREFPEALNATSCALLGASHMDRVQLLADVLTELEQTLSRALHHGLAPWRDRLNTIDALYGKPVRNDDKHGIAQGIDDDGRLRVLERDGQLRLWSSGEVHLGT
jgi:BirA family transcriptional regulator, biotin operon repressor / biotin---[acetyl-CoA-carboxylase] ligase